MSISQRWTKFQENHPVIAAYAVVTIITLFALLVLFVATHGQGQATITAHAKEIACIHAYGHYDAERDVCLIRD